MLTALSNAAEPIMLEPVTVLPRGRRYEPIKSQLGVQLSLFRVCVRVGSTMTRGATAHHGVLRCFRSRTQMMDESVLPYVPWREDNNGDLQEVRITEPWTKYYPGGVWSDFIDCQWKVHTLVHTLDPL
jgi:hypothetical protein